MVYVKINIRVVAIARISIIASVVSFDMILIGMESSKVKGRIV